ncbi:hypothetical protein M011DRAFT_472581 [Sporormia fimetaria CBS 119925]|uniref:Uncharacterized protein n=1 Tax=Sporormia fimetaria CBS 119925 TaxID=1340428 RepID=A0A6A6UWZ7_9PLEO|nr:hypothetical protein M011DRAFT_472581 [Sporormia fimetaria CBS 119925]
MLGFRPLNIGKRKPQAYNQIPSYDVESPSLGEKAYDSDESYASSPLSSATYSRASSGSYAPPRRTSSKATVSAYSYRNPRAFTRYLGLAIGTTLLLFFWFLFSARGTSIRNVEMGLHRAPPPPPIWEKFPFLKRYHGGIRTLVSREKNVPEYPTKQDISPDVAPAAKLHKDTVKERGVQGQVPASEAFDPFVEDAGTALPETCYLDVEDTVRVPQLRVYPGVTEGMPDNVMGSYDLLGLRNDVCFERFGRLGPYGLGYSRKHGGTGAGMEGDREGIEKVWEEQPEVDYREVKWGEAQQRCYKKNAGRFQATPKGGNPLLHSIIPDAEEAKTKNQSDEGKYTNSTARPRTTQNAELLPRTVVLIRTWHDYKYDDEDILYLRALVAELSIQSGGEYIVHFLIHVKDNDLPIWASEEVYQEVLAASLPAEFAGMGTLWSERQMSLIYGGLEETNYRDLPVYGAYRSTFLPVMYFAHQHPEFDFFWHWEMDVRYTGHYYHLFSQVSKWAAAQPRKGLWERNARFYVPSVHGSWEEFTHMVRVQTMHGTNSAANKWSSQLPPNPNMPEREMQKPEKPIWGPEPPPDFPEIELDPSLQPPTDYDSDKSQWGVGEAADLVVFNPLFDPESTHWLLAGDVTGYNTTRGLPPRRAAINTSSRLSRRLLLKMHNETFRHRHILFSEMHPATIALHHGLKAVYAPHPVFIDRRWPTQYLAAIMNNGRNGASGGSLLSVFSEERQHNFLGTTWYYHAGHAPNVWKRWLGYRVDGDGGEEEEVAREGRMCLPAMLLHPVKEVELVIDWEGQRGEGGGG